MPSSNDQLSDVLNDWKDSKCDIGIFLHSPKHSFVKFRGVISEARPTLRIAGDCFVLELNLKGATFRKVELKDALLLPSPEETFDRILEIRSGASYLCTLYGFRKNCPTNTVG